MSSPFDQIAWRYGALWSDAPEGRSQREEVWREIDPLFHPGDRILDLGCGTGDDALHLMARGVEVRGIDSAPGMVERARARGADAHCLPIEGLAGLEPRFHGALSNFGVLNCVTDLRGVAGELARLIEPGGYFALCVMGRFSWRETARFLLRFDVRRAVRRWTGRATWRGMEIRYWSARELLTAFAPYFQMERRIPVGGGDHQLYVFRRHLKPTLQTAGSDTLRWGGQSCPQPPFRRLGERPRVLQEPAGSRLRARLPAPQDAEACSTSEESPC